MINAIRDNLYQELALLIGATKLNLKSILSNNILCFEI